MEEMIDTGFWFSDVLEACHNELRTIFEPKIFVTQAEPEVAAFTAITLRLVRLAKATALLSKEGIVEESQLPYRSATESVVNLLYIMYAGPATGTKSRNALAQQFIAYADVAYLKMLQARPSQARAAFNKRQGMSDTQFDTFMAEKMNLAQHAAEVHGCTKTRWHGTSLAAMAKIVRDNLPPFVNPDIAGQLLSTFVSANSATHSDALSLRSQYIELGNRPLELVYRADPVYADVVANEALWAWKTLADYYGQLDTVEECFRRHLEQEFNRRVAVNSASI
jgi:hypothetical protein